MLCQRCGKRPATTHITHTINGKTSVWNLCEQCAAEQGLDNPMGGFGLDLHDFWGSLFSEPTKHVPQDTARCEDCGRSFREIAQEGRPGCPTCYRTFYDRLLPSIQRIHGKTQHTGKVADKAEEAAKKEHELQALREQLADCVAKQEYEQCAALRDKIRALEKGDAQ